MKFCSSETLDGISENEIKDFLTELAVKNNVSASTQNQAFNALLFVFRDVKKREIQFLDTVLAKKPERLPVVLTRAEVQRLLSQSGGARPADGATAVWCRVAAYGMPAAASQ